MGTGIAPLFIESDMKNVWNDLFEKSQKATNDFLSFITNIENFFDHAMGLRAKHLRSCSVEKDMFVVFLNISGIGSGPFF